MPRKKLDLHEDVTFISDDERKYPEERHRGKKCPSEGMDNNQVERSFKRWRTQGERRYGMGEWGGGKGT